MKIQISDHFNYKKLFFFVLPSIFMMVVTSVYGVIDGLFVSTLSEKRLLPQSISLCPLL